MEVTTMNAEVAKMNRVAHRITTEGREALEVRGVTDVVRFDEQTVMLKTVCGGLTVEGSSLHIHVLSMEEGIVTMDGRIDSMIYEDTEDSDKGGRAGILGRLFR
jgi:sporulation protein YabP